MKPIIYQLLPRLFGNTKSECLPYGTLAQNGCGKFDDITPEVLQQIHELGATHVWYTGVIEHATCSDYSAFGIPADDPHVVKGQAGSPYAIKDYYDVDPDLAVNVPHRMFEFEQLIERTHRENLKVLIDFVPNHVARRYHSDVAPKGIEDLGQGDDTTKFFSPNNNFYYIPRQLFQPHFPIGNYNEFPAKASGNDCFNAFPGRNDWYETVKLNYGVDYGDWSRHFDPVPSTWLKMLHILRFWASKGVDGFRCDMAFMVPVEFWDWAIPQVKRDYPSLIFIAEIYEVNLYREFLERGHFDYLYDKVNLYDTLRGIQTANISAATLTDCWQRVDGLGPRLLNFLENHDEQRFASSQYAGDAAVVLPSLVVSAMLSTGPMMIYAGQELGEKAEDAEGFSGSDGRTTIFDYWSVPTLREWMTGKLSNQQKSLRKVYAQILGLCNTQEAIFSGSFFDLMYVNLDNPRFSPHRHYAFLRYTPGQILLIAVNFSGEAADVEINIPSLALTMAEVKPGKRQAKELISGRRAIKEISAEIPFLTPIPAHGAVIWDVTAMVEKPSKTATA